MKPAEHEAVNILCIICSEYWSVCAFFAVWIIIHAAFHVGIAWENENNVQVTLLGAVCW